MWIMRGGNRQLWHGLFCVAVAATSAATARTDESRTLGGDPPVLSGRPTDIHDGDTFRFGATRIRIAGVDAPELETRYGPAARSALIAAIGSGDVVCEDTGARSYRRVVARCVNAQGQDLSAVMARSGWAVDWWSFSCGSHLAEERDAQRARRGMYAYGVQPWRERPPYARQCGVAGRDRGARGRASRSG